MPLDFQITNLLSVKAMESVEWSGGLIVLVVDALDEPASNNHQKELLKALSKGFHDLPSFLRVVVVSHQESDIQHALGSHLARKALQTQLCTAAQTVALPLGHWAISPSRFWYDTASLGHVDIVNLLLEQENVDDRMERHVRAW